MSILAILFTLMSCVVAVVMPWVGIVIYYVISVGQLTSMFPHHFGQGRTSLLISLSVIIGLGVATATQQVDWRRLLHKHNVLMMVLVVFANIGVQNSPFEGFEEFKIAQLTPAEMISIFNKIMLIYFAAALLIDTRYKLIVLLLAISGVLVYYIGWANKIYLTQQFQWFGDNGRLNGPEGIYNDENYLAMVFLLATPIFYYFSVATQSWVIRFGLWLSILASWHALFLTGSRGGLFSLGVVCIYIFFRSYSKKASVILMVALCVAVIDQSGSMLDRISRTYYTEEVERDRAFIESTDDDDVSDVVLDPRLISWKVGLSLMRDYPLFGVGMGNFMRAFPTYDDSEPHVAHNTVLQFTSSCGIVAGLIYVYFLLVRLKLVFKKKDPEKKYPNDLPRDYLDDLITALFVAFYTVAFFLDLMVLEILYFIFLVGYCKYSLTYEKPRKRYSINAGSIYARATGAKPKPVAQVPEENIDQPINSQVTNSYYRPDVNQYSESVAEVAEEQQQNFGDRYAGRGYIADR